MCPESQSSWRRARVGSQATRPGARSFPVPPHHLRAALSWKGQSPIGRQVPFSKRPLNGGRGRQRGDSPLWRSGSYLGWNCLSAPTAGCCCPHPHARCPWEPALWSASRPGQAALRPSLPGQGFHTQENNFLVRRLEGSGRSREQDGARVRQERNSGRGRGAGGGAGGSVTVNQGADPSNPASRLS